MSLQVETELVARTIAPAMLAPELCLRAQKLLRVFVHVDVTLGIAKFLARLKFVTSIRLGTFVGR